MPLDRRYNWLGTIFYISYLVFEYPQNLALQRFPVGKWMRFVPSTIKFKKNCFLILDRGVVLTSLFGVSPCAATPRAKASVDFSPYDLYWECAKAQSLQAS